MATQRPLISSATGQFQRLPTSDTLELSTLGTGIPDTTTFLRGDGTWATPTSEATSLALSSVTAATATNTILNGDNAQNWKWALTSIVKSGLTLTESAASTNGGSSQVLLDIASVAASTATPLKVSSRGVEAFRVNADGNVGIGTSTPLRKLDISGGGVAFTEIAGAADRKIHWGDTTSIYPVTITGNATDGNCYLSFGTATFGNIALERMRIDSAGNVGIGTAAPSAALDVNANTVRVRTAKTPTSATDTGNAGDICWDTNYVYVCVAANTWKRSALTTW